MSLAAAAGLAGVSLAPIPASAQDAASAEARAPVNLTGYWVSVVTEDWAWRMRTPARGDYASVPLNDAGIRKADTWTEDQDGSCLAFGAAALLRMPVRAHITWADENTLRIETDNGSQTRSLRFVDGTDATGATDAIDATATGATANGANARPSLQGFSVAEWQIAGSVTGSGATGGILTSALAAPPWATLEVVTTQMSPAWLRRNGVPYSDKAVMTEYFDRFDDGEDQWFTVTTIVDDPVYLTEPFIVSSNFKRERDGSKWNPKPCD